VINCN